MLKVIFCKGLPGSGKSTWSKKFCEENQTYIRVCRDDIRTMRGKYWIPNQEGFISRVELETIANALQFGYNVVVDATNFSQKWVDEIKRVANDETNNECVFEEKFFDISLDECIARDAKRANPVGKKVIKDFYNKYLKPEPIKQDILLPTAIICDLDGTLAIGTGRNMYDDMKCYSDDVNKNVLEYLKGKQYICFIIFISGREDKSREETLRWLNDKCGFVNPLLYMRKTGDNRNDAIIKREIFEANIRPKFFVKLVLDDRDRVVAMWRELGLEVWQVNDGDF